MTFESYRLGCAARQAVALERRPGNALNVEIGAASDRCLDKRPAHWPESMSALRWVASGGSALVLGMCAEPCPHLMLADNCRQSDKDCQGVER